MPGTASPLRLGAIEVWPPVVLAPMAGVTTPAFRRLCRRYGAGLYVSEMVNARGLVEGGAKSWALAEVDEDESPRSVQLYGTDPATIGAAVTRLVGDAGVDHVDLNLGCPVRKVTRHGGGVAVTARPRLVEAIVGAAVAGAQAAAPTGGPAAPVTVKTRLGLDDERLTFLDTGRAAEQGGAAAVALHARTAAQLYSGTADWAAIERLVGHLDIPVLGNGDIWTADDALALMRTTGAAGVVVGRGCLGRPWLFRDLADAFAGRTPQPAPALEEVGRVLIEHARLLVARRGETAALRELRKHTGWYLTGYPVGAETRRALAQVTRLAELEAIVAAFDPSATAPAELADAPRGTRAGPQVVTIPEGWADLEDASAPAHDPAAELAIAGG
jgi:nifR3 family TIM-barrel protein